MSEDREKSFEPEEIGPDHPLHAILQQMAQGLPGAHVIRVMTKDSDERQPRVPGWMVWLAERSVWEWDNMIARPLIGLVEIIYGRCPGWLYRFLYGANEEAPNPPTNRFGALLHGLVHFVIGFCKAGAVPYWLNALHAWTANLADARIRHRKRRKIQARMAELFKPGGLREKLRNLSDEDFALELLEGQAQFEAFSPPWEVLEQAGRRLRRARGGPLTREDWAATGPVAGDPSSPKPTAEQQPTPPAGRDEPVEPIQNSEEVLKTFNDVMAEIDEQDRAARAAAEEKRAKKAAGGKDDKPATSGQEPPPSPRSDG